MSAMSESETFLYLTMKVKRLDVARLPDGIACAVSK